MQVEVPQVYWHDNSLPIMSLDFYPNSSYLVTAGVGEEGSPVLRVSFQLILYFQLWYIKELEIEKAARQVAANHKGERIEARYFPEFMYDINAIQAKFINIVRFSPNGQMLAAGCDGNEVQIFTMRQSYTGFGATDARPQFVHSKKLLGHVGEITDLQWSSDSQYLVSGSVDSTAILWSTTTFSKV